MGPTPSQPCARRAQPPPCSRHLRDLQAALHDHYAFLPAARGQQLDLGVAAPLLEHLARSRGGRGGGAHPRAVPALNLLPPDVPDPCPFSTPTWPRARLRGWQGCSWPEPEVGVARGSGPGLARAEAEAHLVRAVGAVLVHADALRAALHLSLLAEVGWGQRGHAHGEGPSGHHTLSHSHPHPGMGCPPNCMEEETVTRGTAAGTPQGQISSLDPPLRSDGEEGTAAMKVLAVICWLAGSGCPLLLTPQSCRYSHLPNTFCEPHPEHPALCRFLPS